MKELRLEGISSIEKANEYLSRRYLAKINAKFAKQPIAPEYAHVPLLMNHDLRDVFCWEERRSLSRDHVIQFERRFYRIPREVLPGPRPGDKVMVRVWLDGTVHFYWKEKPLRLEEFSMKREEESLAITSAQAC